MEHIKDSFRVATPLEQTWATLLDIERIAPCMPGAQLQEIEGDEYRGIVKIKVGPIQAQYKGAAKLASVDEATRTITIDASGRDTRGQGNASAMITVTWAGDDAGTTVDIDTELNVTGKVAQFGRGEMSKISAKLLKQFVDNLERDVLQGEAVASAAPAKPAKAGPAKTATAKKAAAKKPAAAKATATKASVTPATATPDMAGEASREPEIAPSAPAVRKIDAPEPEPINALDLAGGTTIAKLVLPLAGLAILLYLIFRRRKS
jgi:carbon monoxide dehydrogenase subunit G